MPALSNPIAFSLFLLVALLSATSSAIPYSYSYRSFYNPYCASYASRIYGYYVGRPHHTCREYYPTGPFAGGCHGTGCARVPYTGVFGHCPAAGCGAFDAPKRRLAFGSTRGGNSININNMNRVHINAVPAPAPPPSEMAPPPSEMAPPPSEMAPPPTEMAPEMPPAPSEMAPADEATTTPMVSGTSPVMPPPMMSGDTSETATNMDSMTVQSENNEAHQANLQKRDAPCGTSCMVHRVRKFVYALPSCMKPHSGTCPFSRSAKIVPLVVPYPIPPSPANHIVVNDKNTVVLNAPAMPPQRKVIQINMPSQPAPPATIYTPVPQPAITPLVVTQPAPVTVTVTQMATPTPTPTPTAAAEVPVTETVQLPTSTVIVMMPTYQTAPCAETACLETVACDQQKMECPSAN